MNKEYCTLQYRSTLKYYTGVFVRYHIRQLVMQDIRVGPTQGMHRDMRDTIESAKLLFLLQYFLNMSVLSLIDVTYKLMCIVPFDFNQ
jgi:hypothetical protein